MSFLFNKKTRVPSIDIDHEMDQESSNSRNNKQDIGKQQSLGRVRSKSSVDKLNQQEEQEQSSSPSNWGILGRARANSSKQTNNNNTDLFHKAEQELEREHSGTMTHLKDKSGKIGDYEDDEEEERQHHEVKTPKRKFSLKRKNNAELLTDQ